MSLFTRQPSLFDYARSALRLSEGTAYAFIRVARKCVEIPELKKAIDDGKLTVPQAKRIAAVITPATQESWILKASELTQRELDREIAEKAPPCKRFQNGYSHGVQGD